MTKLIFLSIFCLILTEYCRCVPSTSDCDVSKGCFRFPNGCVDGDCKLLHKWVSDGESVLFELNGRYEDYAAMDKIWLAIGFSYDSVMGNDSVSMCRYSVSADPIQTVETRYNVMRTRAPIILDPTNPQLGLSDISVTVDGLFLTCKFRRQKSNPLDGFHDLHAPWYVLGAQGRLNFANNTLVRHTTRHPGTVLVDFSQFNVPVAPVGCSQ